ncbi:hypothetical protein FRB99_007547 [Tulasnella sp. 403]|nr:hypothetical protein FRB99_007547 [Tulasnella sp. 403]
MGLAGVKAKQRIGNDPRNLNWSENAARFGHAYLSKFGWTSEDGLGSNKDGRRSHITVAQKLNMLGIGGDRPDGPDAIAWKQNKDFEGVLERLNRVRQDESSATPSDADGESKDNADQVETGKAEPSSSDDRKGRKLEKKQRKAEKALRKARKQKGKEKADGENGEQEVSRTADSVRAKPPIRMAHRARHRAAKGMVGLSAAALAEVLGESSSASPAVTPGTSTPLPEPPVIPDPQFTTSTKSISDYFKQKLQTKGQTAMPSSRTAEPDYEDYERPRFGLGSSRRPITRAETEA